MANVRTVFLSSKGSNNESELECYCNYRGEIYIQITDEGDPPQYVSLDVSTAIKLAKTLRTEINKAKEVNNV